MNNQNQNEPRLIRWANFIFDRVFPSVRPVFWPFFFLRVMYRAGRSVFQLLANEYLKTRLAYCGEGVRLHGALVMTAPGKVRVGHNVHINDNAYLRSEGGLEFGDNVHISRNLTVYTRNHNYQGSLLPYDFHNLEKPVVIERNVWIGMNVSIAPGVTIGEGSIVGLGAVIVKDIPPLSIVGAVPASLIKERNAEHYNKLDEAALYSGMSGYPNRQLNSVPDSSKHPQ